MTSFGIIKRDDSRSIHGVLMIVDDRIEAEEIAWELNRRGQVVDIHEFEI